MTRVNVVNWGVGAPWQPHRGGPHRATTAPGQHDGRSNADKPTRGGASPELAGKCVRGTERGAARHVRTVTRSRVEWWWWHRRTWPETSPATRSAAERLRSMVEKMLRHATAQAKGLGGSSSPPGVRYGDLTEQEELGISCAAAMADGGAAFGRRWQRWLRRRKRMREGGERRAGLQ